MERRVLIVESQNEFALGMASVLRSAGFQTATAENAADAQRELELRRPDLVVLRAELPDQSGFVLCGQIKKGRFGQNLPVLLLSSDVGQEGLAQHSQGPNAADGYLTIPFEMGELAELTHGIMSGRNPRPRVERAPEVTGGPSGIDPRRGSAGERAGLQGGPHLAQHVAEAQARDRLPHATRLNGRDGLLANPGSRPGQRSHEDPADQEEEATGQQQRHQSQPRLDPTRHHVGTSRSPRPRLAFPLHCTHRTNARARPPHL